MKKHLIVFLLLLASAIGNNLSAGDNIKLRFNKNKEFKIVQFTDLHWSDKSVNCAKTKSVIFDVIHNENPDLVVLTGDVVTDIPAEAGWNSIAKIFEEAKIPWAITLGNHDDETGISREAIFDLLESKPYFIGEKGDTSGAGNYVLPVYGSNNSKVSSLLYCIDTHNKPPRHNYGHYDWIHFDQIKWYRETSERYTKQNNNAPYPSLAFMHIPFLEFKNIDGKERTIGTRKEGVASPNINSGMFCSMVEMNDVMGVFVGHDHNNDYIGIDQGIALAFGRVTGVDAYGILERGGRVILMREGKTAFETWLTSKNGREHLFYYPSGLSGHDEENMTYLPAMKLKAIPKTNGVAYKYYEGKRYKSVDQIEKDKPVRTGVINNFDIGIATVADSMAFVFETLIKIEERGVYNFYTYSDDGSKIYIDGQQVVDNDGSHSLRYAQGMVALEAGWHRIKVLYFESYMGQMLEVGFMGKNIRETLLRDDMLYIAD